jgi:methionine-rich copper-binding protein CopC
MRSVRLLTLAAIIALSGFGIALAHALPKAGEPAAGAAVAAAPTAMSITFTKSIGSHIGRIIVENGKRQRVDDGDTKPDPGDAKRLSVGAKQPLHVRTYTVNWHVLSTDGHRTHGTYSFTITP